MTNEDMYNGITDIKDSIILEADTYEFKKEKRTGVRKPVYMFVAAACLCLVVGVSAFVISISNGQRNRQVFRTMRVLRHRCSAEN